MIKNRTRGHTKSIDLSMRGHQRGSHCAIERRSGCFVIYTYKGGPVVQAAGGGPLDGATVERAAALVAREHAAARRVRPELPAAFENAEVCAAALERLSGGGHHGLVATQDGRAVAVMTVAVRKHPALGRYARLPAEGFAVEPDLADPTGVLAAAFGDLASPLIASGVLHYYLLHTALPRLPEALSNLGFGRNGAYGIQPAAPRRRSSAVAVHVAGVEHLDPSHASP